MKFAVAVLGIFLLNITILSCFPQGKDYPLKLQPELDVLDVETYLSNPRLLNLQIKCILYDGPCDVVGRWAKPRVKAGLLGECLYCTEKQRGWLDTWLEKLIQNFPELYRAGVAKFILNTGVQVPKDEVDKLKTTFAKLDKEGLIAIVKSNTTSTTTTTTAATNSKRKSEEQEPEEVTTIPPVASVNASEILKA